VVDQKKERWRKKTGPKPKPKSELRKHQVNARLNEAELKQLDQGRPEKVTRGSWIRIRALARELPRPIPEINRDAWTALATAVANLNQLTKAVNQGRVTGVTPAELEALTTQVQNLRLELLKGGRD